MLGRSHMAVGSAWIGMQGGFEKREGWKQGNF